jgi:hypothetical protein
MPLVTFDVASAGAALTNIPPRIAKAATSAAVRVLLINHGENIRDLNAARKSSLISFPLHSPLLSS